MRLRSVAVVHGAVSIVNALATGFGSALGISLKVQVEMVAEKGSGIIFESGNSNMMINRIIEDVLSPNFTSKYLLKIRIDSEIPLGVGLKSSSAVSSAVALACIGLVGNNVQDEHVLDSAVNASLFAGTTVTGAYDDSTACYFGGFVVTDNYKRKILRQDRCPDDVAVIIHVPKNCQRGDLSKLKLLSEFYNDAYKMAYDGNYWKAMILNGILNSSILLGDYLPARLAIENGALAAGMSGNGPSTAAVAHKEDANKIRSVFEGLNGDVIVSLVNNRKATLVKKIG
ncbi:MAG: shikimate kinase [Thermoproteota archaeon]|nr:shikimate kinase [Thermoproteota archaeon]